jgi:ferrous iron transport protein B
VATDARRGVGIDRLRAVIGQALADPPRPRPLSLAYPAELLSEAREIAGALPDGWRGGEGRERALALWALTSLEEHDELEGIDDGLRDQVKRTRERARGRDLDLEVVAPRYAFVDALLPELHARVIEHPPKRVVSERIDRVLLHPIFGFAIFAGLMLTLFQALFTWANPAIEAIELLVGALQGWGRALLPAGIVTDLVLEGVIGGVGNVIVFLPQILLLFLFIGLLEDSGYMARVAFLMDRVMRALGLHGRAFVPLLSGYACAVPAILATRTMERRRDRLLTMLVVPLMTCSARLPVYTLIIAALFPPTYFFGWLPVQGLLMIGMYLFSAFAALGVAFVLGRSVVRGRRVPLILELPPYRMPSLRVTLRAMFERAGVFLTAAGTVILALTVVLWFLLSFPRTDGTVAPADPGGAGAVPAAPASTPIEQSYAGRLGKAIEPAIEPLGFDWKIGIGLIGAFAAREVFVSTMGLVYGIGEGAEGDAPLRDRMRAETRHDGKPAYTPLIGLSLLVFFALACQCMGTLAVVRRETRSWRWPAFLFAYTGALAWVASFIVYQGGKLFGFG